MSAHSRPHLTRDDDERFERYKFRVKYAACPELREAKLRDKAAQKAAKLQMVEWQKIKDEQCRGLAQSKASWFQRETPELKPSFTSPLWKEVVIDGYKRWIYDHWMVEFTINELRNMLHRPIAADGATYTTYAFPRQAPVFIVDAVLGKHIDLTSEEQNPLRMCRRAPSVYSRRYWKQDDADAQVMRGVRLGRKLWISYSCSGIQGMHYRFEAADQQSEFWRMLYTDEWPRQYKITKSRDMRCPHVFDEVVPDLPDPENEHADWARQAHDFFDDAPGNWTQEEPPRGDAQFADINMSVFRQGGSAVF